jgi:hypothetical protein
VMIINSTYRPYQQNKQPPLYAVMVINSTYTLPLNMAACVLFARPNGYLSWQTPRLAVPL